MYPPNEEGGTLHCPSNGKHHSTNHNGEFPSNQIRNSWKKNCRTVYSNFIHNNKHPVVTVYTCFTGTQTTLKTSICYTETRTVLETSTCYTETRTILETSTCYTETQTILETSTCYTETRTILETSSLSAKERRAGKSVVQWRQRGLKSPLSPSWWIWGHAAPEKSAKKFNYLLRGISFLAGLQVVGVNAQTDILPAPRAPTRHPREKVETIRP